MNKDLIARAEILIEALPYIQRFRGKTFVIKYGGHAMQSDRAAHELRPGRGAARGGRHQPGGGARRRSADNQLIGKLGLKSHFVRGMRVTDAPTMEAVEMVLQRINKDIVAMISRHGGRAVGLSGKDGDLIVSRKMRMVVKDEDGRRSAVDIGLVGEVAEVNPRDAPDS